MSGNDGGDGVRYASSDGLSIAYRVFGAGPRVTVIVPGLVSHLGMYEELPFYGPIVERLSKVGRVILFDKRGTGLSERRLGHGTAEDRMHDVGAVMDNAGVDRASLVAVSEGGPLAVLFAATYPARVERLALLSSFARTAWAPDYPGGTPPEHAERLVASIERRWGSGEVLSRYVSHAPNPEAMRARTATYELYSCTPAVAATIMRSNLSIDVRDVLPAVSAPALVIHAKNDPVVPVAWGRALADGLPGAEWVEFDGEFHFSWDPSETGPVHDRLERFLTGSSSHTVATDRVLATVMFTDISGSTAQMAGLGDGAWRDLLDRHDRLVRDELARHHGREIKTTGDGFLAAFDGPARAVRCAQAIVAGADAIGLRVRAAVHTGECERRGDDLAGLAVNLSARLLELAGPGEVLASGTVRDLVVGSALQFEDRGREALRGVPGEWQVVAATP